MNTIPTIESHPLITPWSLAHSLSMIGLSLCQSITHSDTKTEQKMRGRKNRTANFLTRIDLYVPSNLHPWKSPSAKRIQSACERRLIFIHEYSFMNIHTGEWINFHLDFSAGRWRMPATRILPNTDPTHFYSSQPQKYSSKIFSQNAWLILPNVVI